MIYYPDSIIQLSWLIRECPDSTFLHVENDIDSAIATCTVLDFTLLEDSFFDNIEHCCNELLE